MGLFISKKQSRTGCRSWSKVVTGLRISIEFRAAKALLRRLSHNNMKGIVKASVKTSMTRIIAIIKYLQLKRFNSVVKPKFNKLTSITQSHIIRRLSGAGAILFCARLLMCEGNSEAPSGAGALANKFTVDNMKHNIANNIIKISCRLVGAHLTFARAPSRCARRNADLAC